MASADLIDELSCIICLNIYTDPVTLRCGHNFCRECIDRVLDSQAASVGFSCPVCREEFQERPELRKNITLCNIAEKMLPSPTRQGPGGTSCTYCIHAHVPAAKSCLQCEAYLCSDHLRVHSRSQEHVLLDPSVSLENRKCSVHQEPLRYFCVRDSACICVSCSLAGRHRGHQVSMLEEASMKKKQNLRKVLEKLTARSEEVEGIIEELQLKWRTTQKKTADIKQKAAEAFKDIRSMVDYLEEEVLAEISGQEQEGSKAVSGLIQQLGAKRVDLDRKVRHIEELCDVMDPLTVLQDPETSRGDFDDTMHVDDVDLDISHKKVYTADDLDENPIAVKLQTISIILKELKCGVCTWVPTSLSMSQDKVCHCNKVSDDLKSVSPSSESCSENIHKVVLSARSFSSGAHYWEVDIGEMGRVGVCYASVTSEGSQSRNKDKCWWLSKFRKYGSWSTIYFALMHNNCKIPVTLNASSSKFRIYLNYEAGQISFYELGDPIRHLHTFTAKFTEPLHAAFYVENNTIRII